MKLVFSIIAIAIISCSFLARLEAGYGQQGGGGGTSVNPGVYMANPATSTVDVSRYGIVNASSITPAAVLLLNSSICVNTGRLTISSAPVCNTGWVFRPAPEGVYISSHESTTGRYSIFLRTGAGQEGKVGFGGRITSDLPSTQVHAYQGIRADTGFSEYIDLVGLTGGGGKVDGNGGVSLRINNVAKVDAWHTNVDISTALYMSNCAIQEVGKIIYTDGSTGVSANTTFYLKLSAAGDVYVGSGSFVAIAGAVSPVHDAWTITGIKGFCVYASTVGNTSFNVAKCTDTGTTSGYSYISGTDVVVTTGTKASAWTDFTLDVTVGAFLSLHATNIPASGTLPSEYGVLVRYYRRP